MQRRTFLESASLAGLSAAAPASQPWKFDPVKQPSGFYSADYRDDFMLGDNPYRYSNWCAAPRRLRRDEPRQQPQTGEHE
jgi:hypothetical protein